MKYADDTVSPSYTLLLHLLRRFTPFSRSSLLCVSLVVFLYCKYIFIFSFLPPPRQQVADEWRPTSTVTTSTYRWQRQQQQEQRLLRPTTAILKYMGSYCCRFCCYSSSSSSPPSQLLIFMYIDLYSNIYCIYIYYYI